MVDSKSQTFASGYLFFTRILRVWERSFRTLGFIKDWALGKLIGCELDDHQEETLSYKEDQFKTFCPSAKTSFPPPENIDESREITVT